MHDIIAMSKGWKSVQLCDRDNETAPGLAATHVASENVD